MRSQRSLTLVVLTVLALAAGFVIYFWSSRKSRAISYHRQQYLALVQEYEQNIDAILKDEPRRYASVQAQVREREALIKLGYLVKKDIPFNGQSWKEFQPMLRRASFKVPIWEGSMPFITNGTRVIRITASPADIPTWERVVAEFNSQINK